MTRLISLRLRLLAVMGRLRVRLMKLSRRWSLRLSQPRFLTKA